MAGSTSYSVLMPLAPWEPLGQVAAALESLAQQTLPCSQVVVSCDGPPPPGLEAVLRASPLPLIQVVGPGGEGVGPVLTRGLQVCSEDFVVRADADDLSLPDRCAIQVEAMNARPDLVALSTPILEFISDPQHVCSQRPAPVGYAALLRRSRWRNPLNHPAVILRRQAVLAVGGYRSCPGFEDYDLWLRLLRQGALLDNLDQPLVFARVGVDHLARRRGLAYLRKELRFLHECGRLGTFSWLRVWLLALIRCPVRLVPAWFQQTVTQSFLRSKPKPS